MRWLISLLLILYLNSKSCFAQDTLNSAIVVQIGMNNLDFQTGLAYVHNWDRIQGFSGLDFGINRTFFQSRAFPRLTVGGAYKLVIKKKFFFGPMLSIGHSILKVNKDSKYLNVWNELYLGTKMEYGETWRFVFAMAAGWQNERYFNTYLNRKSGVNSVGFNVNMGIAYAW